MKLFGVDLDSDLAIIAEIGVNHEGDVAAAARLIEAAARAGANAVKFQSYSTERFISSADAERTARVKKFGLDEAAHRSLARIAADNGIAFFSSAITEDWVQLIAELGAAIKIASGDLTFAPVLAAAAATGKPVILSTGAATADEIDEAVAIIKGAAKAQDVSGQLALLHCVSSYPCPIEQCNLHSIPFMAERYKLAVGWSNHVIGEEACIAAVALGAKIVEVHFTDRKEGRAFRDHSLSFEPDELAHLIKTLKSVRASLGRFGKQPAACEADMRAAIRKGIVAARDLAAGDVLTRADLMFARPATEFAAADIDRVIGKTLRLPLRKGQTLPRSALAGADGPSAAVAGRG